MSRVEHVDRVERVSYNPDVLSCLANLSNDEVFTPPAVVNQMLDLLPQELFASPKTKFLDPATKSGVFLREITKRLIKGLENEIPDLRARVDHILQTQVFGIATTELTSLVARRSLYCSKYPNCKYSVSKFDTVEGNIRFRALKHTFVNGRCKWCGASASQFDRDASLESHAYEFIHTSNPEEIFNMKFDVIISNPPYQMNDGGNGVSATSIFQNFVQSGINLAPHYLIMIIPARWYAGGKGLDSFRAMMLENSHIQKLVDYESSKNCFEGVNIAGGICYFLWNRDYSGPCEITNVELENRMPMKRSLNEFPILIRSNLAVSIVRKVLLRTPDVYSRHALPRNPFGFATNYRGHVEKNEGDIEILTSVGMQYVKRSEVIKSKHVIDWYKILIGRLVPSNGELDVDPKDGYRVITDTRMIGPGQINTETYLDIGVFPTRKKAENFERYLKTKFVRFLLRQAISSLNVTRECFRFVPYEDFSKPWTDEELYKKYGLTDEEIQFIESMIRPME